jgi:cysteine-S-conjugate beta-lyase
VKKNTALIHHPYTPPEGFASPAVPVHKGSSVFFDSVAAMRSRTWLDRSGYTYGLHGTPTSFTLEERIATLEGGTHTMLVSSGLAAVTMVDIALLKSGDHVLLPHNVYAPNKNFTRTELAAWDIQHAVYDAMDAASLAAAITPVTKLLWLEAAGSVTLEFPDLRSLIRVVRERAPQAVIALDNTWGAGIAFDAFALGIDVTVHALTKYPSGGGDVLMGAVTCRDDALYRTLALSRSRVGHGVGINDVEFVLRSLPRRCGPSLRGLVPITQRIRSCAAPGLARLAGPRALGLALQCGGGAGDGGDRSSIRQRADRWLRRCAPALSHRL